MDISNIKIGTKITGVYTESTETIEIKLGIGEV